MDISRLFPSSLLVSCVFKRGQKGEMYKKKKKKAQTIKLGVNYSCTFDIVILASSFLCLYIAFYCSYFLRDAAHST